MEKIIKVQDIKSSGVGFSCLLPTVARFNSRWRVYLATYCLLVFLCLLPSTHCFSQSRVTTFGIQFKPIFPIDFLGTGKQTVTVDSSNLKFGLALKGGYNFGMVIRKGFSDLLAMEVGINYVKRTYHLDINDAEYSEASDFRIIGYEIPASLLVYIRLGEKTFMNASLGASADMYASNVQSIGTNHNSLTVRNHTFQAAIIANLGWEYRTENSGYFYIGGTLHRPFDYEFTTRVHYKRNQKELDVYQPLSGSYLTLDIKYFFHEDPKKKKKKKVSSPE